MPAASREQLVFGDDREGWGVQSAPRSAQPQESAGKFALDDSVRRVRAERRHRLSAKRFGRQVMLREERPQAINLAAAAGDDHDRALSPQRFEVGDGLRKGAALDTNPDRLGPVGFEAQHRRIVCAPELGFPSPWNRLEGHHATRAARLPQMPEGEKKLIRGRQRRAGGFKRAVGLLYLDEKFIGVYVQVQRFVRD